MVKNKKIIGKRQRRQRMKKGGKKEKMTKKIGLAHN